MRAAERREHFLDVAAQLVIERGPDAVTMERVSEIADVNRALIYRFFANREELLVQLVERESQRLDDAVGAALEQATTFEETTRAIVATYLDLELRDEMLVSRRIGSMPMASGLLLDWQRARVETTVAFLMDLERRHHPALSTQEALVLAASLSSAVNGVLALAEEGLAANQMLETFVQLCVGASEHVNALAVARRQARKRTSKKAAATKPRPSRSARR